MTQPRDALPVTIAVVNFNGARYLTGCLDAIAAQTARPREVVVVDNASTDGSAALAEQREGVRVLRLGTNLGPGSARNAALRDSSTRLVLLMDNDVILTPDCLARLHEALTGRADAAICQARTVYDDRPDLVQCDGGTVHFLGPMILRNTHRSLATLDREVAEVDSVITTAVLVDREAALETGGFDEDFFIYFEDHDWSVRTRLAGHRCLSAGSAVVRHRGGTAELSFRTGGSYTARRFYLQLRNRWIFVLKVYPLRSLLLLAPAFGLFETFSFAYACTRGFAGTYFRAAGWIVGHLGDLHRKRRELRRRQRIPLRVLLTGAPYPFHPGLLTAAWQRLCVGALDRATLAWWGLVRRLV